MTGIILRMAALASAHPNLAMLADDFGDVAKKINPGYLQHWARACVGLSATLKDGGELMFARIRGSEEVYFSATGFPQANSSGLSCGPNPLGGRLPDRAVLPAAAVPSIDDLYTFGKNVRAWSNAVMDDPAMMPDGELANLSCSLSLTHVLPVLLTFVEPGSKLSEYYSVLTAHLKIEARMNPGVKLDTYVKNEIVPLLIAKPNIDAFMSALALMRKLETQTGTQGWANTAAVLTKKQGLTDNEGAYMKLILDVYQAIKARDLAGLLGMYGKRRLIPVLLGLPLQQAAITLMLARTSWHMRERFITLDGAIGRRLAGDSFEAYFTRALPVIIMKENFNAWEEVFLEILRQNLRPEDRQTASLIERISDAMAAAKDIESFKALARATNWSA